MTTGSTITTVKDKAYMDQAEDFRKYLRLSWDNINDDQELCTRFWDALYDIENNSALFVEAAEHYGLD